MPFTLASPVFEHEGDIPTRYTCDGNDVSPPLEWSDAPAGTKSLALVVDDPDAPDPDAPKMTWVHWVLYDIPATETGLREGVGHDLPPGTKEGITDRKRTDYNGPCPPVGRHRYFFKLYALDTVLPDLGLPRKDALERAMAPHLLGEAELMGMYASAPRR